MSQKDAKRLNLAPLEERPGDKNSGQEDPGDLGDPVGGQGPPALDLPRQTSAPDPLKRGRTGLPPAAGPEPGAVPLPSHLVA
jgi:hypothetical protein